MSPPFKRAKERVAWGRSGRNRTSFCIHLRGQVKAQAVGVHVARPVLLSPPTHPLDFAPERTHRRVPESDRLVGISSTEVLKLRSVRARRPVFVPREVNSMR